MFRSILMALYGLLICFSGSVSGATSVNKMELDLLEGYELPLRWDNIKADECIIIGPEPRYNFNYDMHTMDLAPGNVVKIIIPEKKMLRILSPDSCTRLDPLRISISNGTGLHAFLPIAMTRDKRSYLVIPENEDPAVCRIFLPESEKQHHKIALFFSRQEIPGKTAPYRELLPLTGKPVAVVQEEILESDSFWHIRPYRPAQVRIKGPARISIENRLLYPDYEKARRTRYFIKLLRDGKEYAILDYETPPETSRTISIHHRPHVCGRTQRSFLNIAEGEHVFTFVPQADIILRVIKHEEPDYLFQGLNAPDSYKEVVNKKVMPNTLHLSSKKISNIVNDQEGGICEVEQAARHMARDNHRPHSGLTAASLMKKQGEKYPAAPHVKNQAHKLYAGHTFFRNLFPWQKKGAVFQEHLQFILPRLKRARDSHMMVAKQHGEKLRKLVQKGYFLSLPTEQESPLTFRLPSRTAPSKLRIIVTPQGVEQRFYIQFDNQKKVCFQVEPAYEAASNQFRITPAEAGLALSALYPEPFDWPLYLENVVRPAFIETDISTNIRELKIWGEPNFSSRLAVQYLDSVPYKMSESEYLQAVGMAGSKEALFTRFVTMLSSDTPWDVYEEPTTFRQILSGDFQSYWTPLVRLIRSNHSLFKGTPTPPLEKPTKSLSDSEIDILMKRGFYLESKQQPLPALEKWAQLFHNTTGEVHDIAAFKVVDQLLSLKETYLAERLLKVLFFQYEKDVSERAFERLLQFYRKGEASGRLLPLYCSRAVLYPTPANIKALARIMFKEGYLLQAVMIETLLPSEDDSEFLLKALGSLGWFQVYGNIVQKFTSPEKISYWQAMAMIYQGKYAQAVEMLRNGGEQGRTLGAVLLKGLSIKDKLISCNRNIRAQGILEWESWYSSLPGEFHWQEEKGAVMDYAGTVSLYSEPRNLHFTAFQSLPLKPVKAIFHGPAKVKVSVRPLHLDQDRPPVPINGWFTLRKNHHNHLFSIVNNLPVQGLTIAGEDDVKPGQKVSYQICLPAGENHIEVQSQFIPLTVTFHVLKPATPVADILPELTWKSAESVMGKGHKPLHGLSTDKAYDCIFNDCLKIISPDHGLQFLNISKHRQLQTKRLVKTKRISREDLQNMRHEDNPDKTEHSRSQSISCYEKEAVFRKMSALVKKGESHPENILQIEADARRLYLQHGHYIGLRALLGQITRHTTWQPAAMVEADSGISGFPLDKWQPESDTMRIRRALLPDIPSQDQVVARDNDLVFYMSNPKPVKVQTKISLLDLPLLQPAPVKFYYRLNGQAPRVMTIFPDSIDHTFTKMIPRGDHRLTIGLLERFENQFLRVRFCESPATALPCNEITLDNPPKRPYYVATAHNPVKVQMLGPAWVRIDQLIQGDTLVEYRYLDKGWKTIVLKPDQDQAEGLFRVHRRVRKVSPPEPQRFRPVDIPFDELPSPYTHVNSPPPLEQVRFCDAYALGSQEDGTWSVTGSYKKPFTIQEDRDGEKEGHIYEVSIAHRYHDSDLPGYFKTSFFSRFRNDGGPTLGLEEDFFYYPEQIPVGLNLRGALHVQKPGVDTFDLFKDASTEYSAFFRARLFQNRKLGLKSFHIPSLTLFGRVLSIDDENEYGDQVVDRDLFSNYKKNHQTGITLSDYYAFMPWLDSVWFLQGAISSNENFNILQPDNIKLHTGWKQLLGNGQINLGYRHVYYFSDNDRELDIKRNFLNLDLTRNQWRADQQRLHMGLRFSLDLDNNEYSLLSYLTWFFSEGKGLKDFRPGEVDFYNIKDRNIPREINNCIETD